MIELPFKLVRALSLIFKALKIDPLIKIDKLKFLLPSKYLEPSLLNLEHVILEKAYTKLRFFKPRNGWKVLDAGAAIGLYSVLAASLGANVIALEPNTELLRYAIINAKINGVSIKALPIALAPRGTSVVKIALSSNPFTSSVFESHAALHGDIKGYLSVRALDFDTLHMLYGPFDLVKLDIECLELEALKSSRAIFNVPKLVIEVHEDCVDVNDVCELLEGKGYRTLVYLDPDEPYQSIVYAFRI